MQRKGPLPGKIFAWCILQRRFAGHFEYMESISCQNQLILDAWRRYLATKGRFYRLRLLPECIRVIFCQEFTSSSDRSALRWCFIQRARLRLSEMSLENASSRNVALRLFGNALQRCFVRCPSSAQANERWLLRCPAYVSLSLRCRGALGDAALRSFGHRMSPLTRMAAERAEHEQVQVRVRARMPLLPPVLRGFGGRRHRGVSSLRALTAAMRIARKRNRSPQNGAGRDDGSSQRSLL